mgnify:CR=1 FL=1
MPIRAYVAMLAIALPLAAQDIGATRGDWPHYGGSQFSWRYSSLDQINTTNVKNLAPAWMFQTGDYAENLQATPIVVDGQPMAAEHSAPRLGEHTAEILKEIGES